MKVLVLGATGFVGSGVADALVRAGHQVLGQTRSLKLHGSDLAKREIEPIESDPVNDDKWATGLDTIDVVVDCLGGSAPLPNLSPKLIKIAEEAKRHSTAAKLVYIWTSGVWLHGDDRLEIVTDGSAVTRAPAKVAWRPAVEDMVCSSQKVDGIVIRPGLVYGRSGSVVGMLFKQASSKKIEWPGEPGGRYATVHIDDLGELYRLAVEKYPLVRHLKIEGSNFSTEGVDLLLSQLSKIAGVDSYAYKAPSNPFEVALSGTSVVRGTFGRSLLGWEPKKASLVDGLPVYYRSYLAHQE
uniref:ARAD1D50798p n=1 Tax=Blastobotrys adeninivorans TaxID=409370 RepID=A0A060TDF1_BLAAD